MLYDQCLDSKLKRLVSSNPRNYAKMLKSKVHNDLYSYVLQCTSIMANEPKHCYKLSTLVFWVLNQISSWDDNRVHCVVCGKPLHCIDVKHVTSGYNRKTCCKACERKVAYASMAKHMHDKYGVSNPFQLPSVINGLKEKKDEIQRHRDATKCKNKTFKASKAEDQAYEILCKKFGADDIVRQFKSEKYPFKCDFYIKSLDLYIECNFSWTHGGHFFDESNEKDQKTLQKWKDKRSKYYDNAVKTWTIRDVEKRRCAIASHLNYVVFWNLSEVKKFTPLNGASTKYSMTKTFHTV